MSNLKNLSKSILNGVFDAMAVHTTLFDKPKFSKKPTITEVSLPETSLENAILSDWQAIGNDLAYVIEHHSLENLKSSEKTNNLHSNAKLTHPQEKQLKSTIY